ncbi:hypothetical protein EXIGLDRAFT_259623 [Exidia glandulosa HHB12029]|uniref:Uncharacterized protein n=1 Tax=Exidia glandulosa HHB12029 TaxID=1314781 RepID=A0A165MEK6_EXIGL|nr:hypothetical protein EXIGLDRAFT_259623 [Exidia glandulosa HHB12029]
MYIFGTVISFMNIAIWGSIAVHFITCEFDGLGCFGSWVGALFMPIIALGMMVFPTFGGLIVLSPVQNNAWHHRCDPFKVQVILDGRSYKDPRYTPDVARFYVGNGAAPLFTYDLDQTNSDAWTFHFRTFDAPEDSLPPAFVPVLRAVTYNFVDNTLNGTCTVSGGNDTLCMTGTFNPGNFLSFDLNYNITGTPVHAPSRAFDKQWAFSDDAPSLILRSVEADNSLGDVILRTAVTKRSDCTQLKVCVDGLSGQGDAAAVGPEVMAPLGLMLARQGDYGIQCTTPSD